MMYGFITAFKTLHPVGTVTITHPIQKFKLLGVKCDTRNKNHKKLMVTICKKYLNTEMLQKFDTFDKKDDIADSMMQYLAVFKKN
jgi:hypothetical protein